MPAAAADWPVYNAPTNGEFTIALPGKVTVKQATNRYPFGLVTITAHTHKADRGTVWRLATHDYPPEFVERFTPRQAHVNYGPRHGQKRKRQTHRPQTH